MSDPLLDGRYRLERQLGSDAIGSSYRATRVDDGQLVRARACLVRQLGRERELGDRLARLRSLEHPALPRRLDEFMLGEASLATQWLIDEHVAGDTLAEAVAAAPKRCVDQARIVAALRELADLLAYLERRDPPIVHGAVTPSLILLRSDGGASLLDLGLASDAVHVAGTRGLADSLHHAAPEQLFADPTPAADVWALGAIAIVALTGVSLSALRAESSTLRWRERVDVDPSFAGLLERMLEADPCKRISAADLAECLAQRALPERFRGSQASLGSRG